MLGCPLELGERRDRQPALVRELVVDLEQQGLVGLDDEGPVAHPPSLPHASDGTDGVATVSLARITGHDRAR
jgi:hypothetical protein